MKKQNFNKQEVKIYLEEVVFMDVATEIEQDVFYKIKYGQPVTKGELREVLSNMKYWYERVWK